MIINKIFFLFYPKRNPPIVEIKVKGMMNDMLYRAKSSYELSSFMCLRRDLLSTVFSAVWLFIEGFEFNIKFYAIFKINTCKDF